MRLVDRCISIGVCGRVGIGDRNASNALPGDDTGWLAALKPEWI
jgi:hypothetical protein